MVFVEASSSCLCFDSFLMYLPNIMALITIAGKVSNMIIDNLGIQTKIIIMPEIKMTSCRINSPSVTEKTDCNCSTSAVMRLVSSPTLFSSKKATGCVMIFSYRSFLRSAIPFSDTIAK